MPFHSPTGVQEIVSEQQLTVAIDARVAFFIYILNIRTEATAEGH